MLSCFGVVLACNVHTVVATGPHVCCHAVSTVAELAYHTCAFVTMSVRSLIMADFAPFLPPFCVDVASLERTRQLFTAIIQAHAYCTLGVRRVSTVKHLLSRTQLNHR